MSDEENKKITKKHAQTYIWYRPVIGKAFDEEEKKFLSNKMIHWEKRFKQSMEGRKPTKVQANMAMELI